MNSLSGRLRSLDQLLNVSSSDPDDARRRKLLNILLISICGFSFGGLILVIIVDRLNLLGPELRFITYASDLALLVGSLILYAINRRERIAEWIPSASFLTFFTLALSFSDTPAELSNGRSLFVFTLPIIMASILLTPASSFLFAGAVSVEIIILSSFGGINPNLFAVVGFFLVALITWLSSRNLEQALYDLREVNANLDKLVEQKTQELALSLSRELVLSGRNQAILNSIADGVIAFDVNNIAILANPALGRLIENPFQNLIGSSIDNFLDSDKLSPSSAKMIKELINRPKDATTIGVRIPWGNKTLSTSIAHVQDTDKNNLGTVGVFHDVTREAELEQLKNTFIAIVSHELRTPLSAILGYAEMLKEGVYGQVTEKQQNVFTRVMTNTERLLEIVNDLLDQAQIEAGKLKIQMVSCKPGELLKNLRDVMDRIMVDKGIELITELDPLMPFSIIGDHQRLQQIMVNLVNNAAKFTENGTVTVKILHLNEKNWQIRVADTGSGIPKEAQAYIFETFRQADEANSRQHGGIGLGLSIVKQLAELMNGNITVESEVGKGSTFTVTLPLVVP